MDFTLGSSVWYYPDHRDHWASGQEGPFAATISAVSQTTDEEGNERDCLSLAILDPLHGQMRVRHDVPLLEKDCDKSAACCTLPGTIDDLKKEEDHAEETEEGHWQEEA